MKIAILKLVIIVLFALNGCAAWNAASAEEYFAIGMAYFDMGKFAEAEKWLIRAKSRDRTMNASEYNLGRIAFETQRYEDAAMHFESILKRDPYNVMALQATAFTYIRMGDIEKAHDFYKRVLDLVPESADDGYNYALVLFAMEKYDEVERILSKEEYALLDNNDVLLLFARAQKEQGKVEAIDSFDKWLTNNTNAKISFEFAQLLEEHDFFARALEEYREINEGLTETSTDPSKQDIGFTIARLLLIADSESTEGVKELETAVEAGFRDIEKIEELLEDERISAANKDSIRIILSDAKRAAEEDETDVTDEETDITDEDENEEADT